MNSKIIGGILLVVGTTIGAGMLALPVATAQLGFFGSVFLLVACWAIMTASAFLFLEVNLYLPPNSNLISMAGATLGKGGQVITWGFYLLLLYSILCAYMAGGGDLLHYILNPLGIHLSPNQGSVLFAILFGSIVYLGMRSVDYVNRGLMFGKMGALVLLIALILPFVTGANLASGEFKHISSPGSITIAVLAFTSMMIIPSLRTYFNDDIKALRKVIFFGSLIPLICYIAWDMVILGVIPLYGSPSMLEISQSDTGNSDLLVALKSLLQKETITIVANFFTSICMATSFLSISLSLSDFLADGLKVAKKGLFGNAIIFGGTFVPPLIGVVLYPDAFQRGLKYAGISCLILMLLMPAVMAWRGRYRLALADGGVQQIAGGKVLLIVLITFAVIMVGFGLKGVL